MHASRTDELMNCFSKAESCLSREFRTGQLMDEVHAVEINQSATELISFSKFQDTHTHVFAAAGE